MNETFKLAGVPQFDECRACSGELRKAVPHKNGRGRTDVTLQTCSACGGMHVRAESFALVLPLVKIDALVAGEASRYFAVRYMSEAAPFTVQSSHGWTDGRGRVVQFG